MPVKKAVASSAELLIPENPTLETLRASAKHCTACDLYKTGTQTVFGEGSQEADVMFVGEQPGNEEDIKGRPFVGPAGRLLDKALIAAGIDRSRTYVTNAVKHFKWVAKGKLRIHGKPNAFEIQACNPWLRHEIAVLKPKVIVCLGATAAQAMMGKAFRVTKERGRFFPHESGAKLMATIHPSAILRSFDEESRRIEMQQLIEDLSRVNTALESSAKQRR